MKKQKQIVLLCICITLLASVDALGLKAAIGVGPFEAMQQSINYVTGIKIGTISIYFNLVFIGVQFLILKKEFKVKQILQIFTSFLVGIIINFALYEVYTFQIDSYWVKVVMILFAYIWCPFVFGIIMCLDIVTLPVEGVCMVLSKKFHVEFGKMRFAADAVFLSTSVLISVLAGVDFAAREGTLIGLLMYGPLMGVFMKIQKPILSKLGYIEEESYEDCLGMCDRDVYQHADREDGTVCTGG